MEDHHVPQATLASVRKIVDACAAAAGTTARELKALVLGLTGRHVDYGVAAARTLGLLNGSGEPLVLTPLGRSLARAAEGSDTERAILKEAVASSSILKRVAPDLLSSTAPTKQALTEAIVAATRLSEGTSAHRAAMLLKWRRHLLSTQTKLFSAGAMWRKIEIRNFRSIEHAEIELAPFTVVVGPNGVGKSNFADALVFARDVAFDASAAISARGGIVGTRRWRPSKPTDVAIDVRAANTRSGLQNSFVRHFFKIHSGRQGDWSFSREEIEVFEGGTRKAFLERRGNKIDGNLRIGSALNQTASAMLAARQTKLFSATSALQNVRRYRLNPDSMRQPQLANDQIRLRENGDNIATSIRGIHEAGRISAIVEPMAKIIPGLEHIYVDQLGRYLALKFRQTQEPGAVADFNATEMSEGALRALGIVVATYQMEQDELLVIEEPEVSIHVGAANLLFDILKEASRRGAVLLTTHSVDLLDAAREEEILVCDYIDGSTRIGRLSTAQREIVREGLFSIAELMRSEPLRIEKVSRVAGSRK